MKEKKENKLNTNLYDRIILPQNNIPLQYRNGLKFRSLGRVYKYDDEKYFSGLLILSLP